MPRAFRTRFRHAVTILAALAVVSCGNGASEITTTTESTDPTELTTTSVSAAESTTTVDDPAAGCTTVEARASHHVSEESPDHLAFQAFVDEVATRTDGRVQIEIFPSAQLGGLVENAENVRTGGIDLAILDSTGVSHFFPEIGAFDLPFQFTSSDQFHEVIDSDFGDYLDDRLRSEVGIEPLYWYSVGLRNMFFGQGVEPVASPDNLSGITMRVPNSPVYQQTFALLGASAVVVEAGELYTSLQTGVVDGFEFPLGPVLDFSLEELIATMSVTGHIHSLHFTAASSGFWESLCEQDREAVAAAASVGSDLARESWQTETQEALDAFASAGIETVEVDRQSFVDAVQPMYEEFTTANGDDLLGRLQTALAG